MQQIIVPVSLSVARHAKPIACPGLLTTSATCELDSRRCGEAVSGPQVLFCNLLAGPVDPFNSMQKCGVLIEWTEDAIPLDRKLRFVIQQALLDDAARMAVPLKSADANLLRAQGLFVASFT